jgi:hypothetical protein
MTRIGGAILSLVLLSLCQSASAVTLLDTIQGRSFGPFPLQGYAVSENAGFVNSLAIPFSSASATTITDVTAYIGTFPGQSGAVTLGIMADSGFGVPTGVFLPNLFQHTAINDTNPIVLNSLNWLISGGTTYWLGAIADIGTETGSWQFNTDVTGEYAFFATQIGFWEAQNPVAPPMALISANSLTIPSTPLPAALPMFTGGLSVLGLVGWRRKRMASRSSIRLSSGTVIVVGVLAALSVAPVPARAATLQFDLTITYLTPPSPILPAGDLTGTPQFFSDNGVIDHLLTITSPTPPPILPLGQTYFVSFAPTDPCFGQSTCAISFSFAGFSQGFSADAFLTGNVPSTGPSPPPILPIAVLQPTDPCAPGDPCHASGPIVAFDDPIVIGSWDVTISAATPLPGALPLFAGGLGALSLLGWRRKKKAALAA